MPVCNTAPDIRGLFPTTVCTRTTGIVGELHTLYPQEQEAVARAVPRRQREFATGRLCARLALTDLGVEDVPILTSTDRSPIWPPGVIGSISHTASLCAAAVAKRESLRSLGLDVEPDLPLERHLWNILCTGQELDWIARQPTDVQGRLVRLFFSTKEAVYKCVFPLAKEPLEFTDLEINFDLPSGEFTARHVNPTAELAPGRCKLDGRFLRTDGYLFTGVVIEHE